MRHRPRYVGRALGLQSRELWRMTKGRRADLCTAVVVSFGNFSISKELLDTFCLVGPPLLLLFM